MSPKEILREKIKNCLKNTAREEFTSQGAGAAALLRNSPVWPRYPVVLLFLSMSSEIDTQPLIELSLKEGKKVFVPRVEAGNIVFCPVQSPRGPWRKGPFGLREPETPGGFPLPAQSGALLILAPGLAFDREGNRLGRGGGYYDHFFANLDAKNTHYTALGFCMDFQLIDHVPAGENDIKMNGLLTGKELILC